MLLLPQLEFLPLDDPCGDVDPADPARPQPHGAVPAVAWAFVPFGRNGVICYVPARQPFSGALPNPPVARILYEGASALVRLCPRQDSNLPFRSMPVHCPSCRYDRLAA